MPAPPPATASSSSPALDSHHDLLKLVRSHEIALAELNSIPASGTVFQRNGNLFFRTTAQKATSYEQKQLEMAKAKLQKLTS
nr:Prefoldin chaperone subunit family protein [Ipomoea batatas]